MNIGKLNKFCLVDIEKDEDIYKYTYLLQSQKLFFKKFNWKLYFFSKLPFYLFTDIGKVFINEGYFFEDLIDKKTNLSIGITKVEKFSKQDSDFYSKKYSHWFSSHFNKAFEKQKKFKKDYEDNYGYPKDLGLHKAWES